MQRVTCCQRGMYRAPCECTEAPCTLSFQEQKDQVGEPLGCASPGSKAEEGKGNKARKKVNDTMQAWAIQGFTRGLQEPSQSVLGERMAPKDVQSLEPVCYVTQQQQFYKRYQIKDLLMGRVSCVTYLGPWNHESSQKRGR